jgi:putative glycosyl hydrolase protein
VIRPWLQAFAWRTKTYSPKYVEVQTEIAKQKGGVGFLFWNANNDYSKPFAAMPEMRTAKDKGRFFRGDELPAKAEPPAVVPVAAAPSPSSAPATPAPATVAPATPTPATAAPATAAPASHSVKIWRH